LKTKFKLFFITTLFLTLAGKGFCQDIYDSSHSFQYANFLFKSKEYQRASLEYERTCFLDSQNWGAHFYLIQSYRKSEQATKGVAHFQQIRYQLPPTEFQRFEHEKNINLFIVQPSYFLAQAQMDSMDELPYFKSPSLLLTHNWKVSRSYLTEVDYKSDKTLAVYYENTLAGLNLNYKKPWLAGTMSALVPGLGKVYSSYYKDGIIAFLMTGISAFQAYRGYNAKGANSGIFIIYTGMTAGFYLGNIYGSIKSARQKNKRLNEAIDKKTRAAFYEWAK
jgi:hypothetical protein